MPNNQMENYLILINCIFILLIEKAKIVSSIENISPLLIPYFMCLPDPFWGMEACYIWVWTLLLCQRSWEISGHFHTIQEWRLGTPALHRWPLFAEYSSFASSTCWKSGFSLSVKHGAMLHSLLNCKPFHKTYVLDSDCFFFSQS